MASASASCFPLWVSLALAPLGFLYPTHRTAGRAQPTDAAASATPSAAFLDLVSISLAGGRRCRTRALHERAEAGHGWAFEEIRHALLEARLLGERPGPVSRLGKSLTCRSSASSPHQSALAGDEGAQRPALASPRRPRSFGPRSRRRREPPRKRRVSECRCRSSLLMLGFVVFLGYPAVEQGPHRPLIRTKRRNPMLSDHLSSSTYDLMTLRRARGDRHNERGETTEKVIITAIFAALAIAAGAIIVAQGHRQGQQHPDR